MVDKLNINLDLPGVKINYFKEIHIKISKVYKEVNNRETKTLRRDDGCNC